MNLYRVLDGGRDTILFIINDCDEEDDNSFDLSLLGEFTDNKELVALDNIILGLPLARIFYILRSNLNELIYEEFNNEAELNATITGKINDFLALSNFTAADITCINSYRGEELDDNSEDDNSEDETLDPTLRVLTDYDKEELRLIVDKEYYIPGIVPTLLYDYRRSIDPTYGDGGVYEADIREDEIVSINVTANAAADNREIENTENSPPSSPVAAGAGSGAASTATGSLPVSIAPTPFASPSRQKPKPLEPPASIPAGASAARSLALTEDLSDGNAATAPGSQATLFGTHGPARLRAPSPSYPERKTPRKSRKNSTFRKRRI